MGSQKLSFILFGAVDSYGPVGSLKGLEKKANLIICKSEFFF
jgi:hypothetical protein